MNRSMVFVRVAFFCLFLLLDTVPQTKGDLEDEDERNSTFRQDWGHINIREGAYMFWWLYYTTADVEVYTKRPLIIWLQGGPGMPSSGYGNFVEIGPLDINYQRKNYTLAEDFNVLFIDNPVGVGYSYVEDNSTQLPKNNKEIADDLMRFFEMFIKKRPEFSNTSLYIFGESYGGKMAVEFAYQIMKDQKQKKKNKWNLRGIGLGNSYISPINYIRSYAPLALHLGLVDKQGFTQIDEWAAHIEQLVTTKQFIEAAHAEHRMANLLVFEMPGIDIYNMVSRMNSSFLPSYLSYLPRFTEMMNTEVKGNLSIGENIEWSFLNNQVYETLHGDLMKPVTKKIEVLLNNTDIKIIVYNGVLDFLVNTAGTRLWMNNLKWKFKDEWREVRQSPFEVEQDIVEGYYKKYGNLILYVVFRAGHSVPVDNMPAFRQILKQELLCGEQ
ncbi:retinoid-inducible serine carboxypeptidase [Aethina tumida]|uniref:retinoid-inducible serine carboxypeptidase n=1 Tax=Aethina tumida TaxID=116153 RepID=UPI00096B6461|nr:retinoid-inducible serine carboxypeptidase [Aethina tumida]